MPASSEPANSSASSSLPVEGTNKPFCDGQTDKMMVRAQFTVDHCRPLASLLFTPPQPQHPPTTTMATIANQPVLHEWANTCGS